MPTSEKAMKSIFSDISEFGMDKSLEIDEMFDVDSKDPFKEFNKNPGKVLSFEEFKKPGKVLKPEKLKNSGNATKVKPKISKEDEFFKKFVSDTYRFWTQTEEPIVPETLGIFKNPKYKKLEGDLYKIAYQIKELIYKGRKMLGPYVGLYFR